MRERSEKMLPTPLIDTSRLSVQVPMRNPKSRLVITPQMQELVQPHALFGRIYEENRTEFHRRFCGPPGAVEEWWQRVEEVEHPALADHPLKGSP